MPLSINKLEKLYDEADYVLKGSNLRKYVTGTHAVPEVVWHYASPKTALSIISSNELWASDIFYMNDAQEVHYGVEFVHEAVEAIITRKKKDALVGTLYDRARSYFAGKRDRTKIFTTRRFFCTSLSADGDDLNLWRGYGDKGVGFSIGLDSSAFKPRESGGMVLELIPIIYERVAQESLVAEILSSHERFVVDNNLSSRLSKAQVKPLIDWFKMSLVEAIFFLKNPAFVGEREWRLLYWYSKAEAGPNSCRVEFRPTLKTIVPFVRLGSDRLLGKSKSHLPIKKITMGPQVESALSSYAIRELLGASGHTPSAVEVKRSRVPFRAL